MTRITFIFLLFTLAACGNTPEERATYVGRSVLGSWCNTSPNCSAHGAGTRP